MKKRKCPKCNSEKTILAERYFSCKRCGFLHKKTEREIKNDNRRNSHI